MIPCDKRPILASVLLGLGYGALLVLAFPPVSLPVFALVIPLPALLATRVETEKPVRAAVGFGLGSVPAWAFFHLYLIDVTAAGYPFVVLFLSGYSALFVVLARRLARVVAWWVAAPLAWAGVEFFRGQIAFDGYPWYLAAQPLAGGFSPLGAVGVYGAGLLVALVWSLGLSRTRLPMFLRLARCGGVVVVFAALSMIGGEGVRSELSVRVAAVQSNVPQDNKVAWTIEQRVRDFEEFVSLTREAAAAEPALIVWPETMFPGGELDAESLAAMRGARLAYPGGLPATWFADELLALQAEIGVPMLVGAIGHDGLRVTTSADGTVGFESDGEFNSAVLIRDGEPVRERYDKVHLTPFGEVMPYISWSDWLEEKLLAIGAGGMTFNLSAGSEATVFEVGGFRFATPICFEATMPGVCRWLAYRDGERRVDALIQLTNDGWFGGYAGGREMHLLLARCRAVELGVPVVRAANTGISAVIDGAGRVMRASRAGEAGVLIADLPIGIRPPTFYGRVVGDSAGWLALCGSFVGFVLSFRKKRPQEISS